MEAHKRTQALLKTENWEPLRDIMKTSNKTIVGNLSKELLTLPKQERDQLVGQIIHELAIVSAVGDSSPRRPRPELCPLDSIYQN